MDSCSTEIPVLAVNKSNRPSETAKESCVRRVTEGLLVFSVEFEFELPQATEIRRSCATANFEIFFTIPPLALSRSGARVNCPPFPDSVLSARMVRAPRMTIHIVSLLNRLVNDFLK